jgi:Fic family protein
MQWQNCRLQQRLSSLSSIEIEQLYSLLVEIDVVKKSWHRINKLCPQTKQCLMQSVIIASTGASNRIEGNRLTDEQIEDLCRNLHAKKLKTRDQQEVVGYFHQLEFIFSNYEHIPITESYILQMHQEMLRYSQKDEGHRGNYKFGSNRVEAHDEHGALVAVVFDPTPPYLVKKEMHELLDWHQWATQEAAKHPLILMANFIFEFLAIHPFQDGNGRMSRLLTNAMLLQQGYQFTTIISHEKIIEAHKDDYYLALQNSQSNWKTDQESIAPWLLFFLKVVKTQAMQALEYLDDDSVERYLSPKQLALWQWAQQLELQEFSRKDAVEALGFHERTVEESIKKLAHLKRLQRWGQGRATRYKVVNP